MMFQVLLLTTLLVAAKASQSDFFDDSLYEKIAEELHLGVDGEQARNLVDIASDGSFGSSCSIFNECKAGFECFRRRCFPNRNCVKEQLEEFNASFDSDDYKQRMFQTTGVTRDDMFSAIRESNGDSVAFVQSEAMQSLINYMQEHSEPFQPVTEIVNSCTGVVSARRLRVDPDIEERRMQSPPVVEAPSAAPAVRTVRVGDNHVDQDHRRLTTPSSSPSMAPSKPQGPQPQQFYLGLHIEGGAIFEVSLTVVWKNGLSNTHTYVRGCFGAEVGAAVEFSFYVAVTIDGTGGGYNCGSVTFDTDAGLALYLGVEFGICFSGTTGIYVGLNIGGGIGAGIGFNVCGTLTLPPRGSRLNETIAPSFAPSFPPQ